MDQIQVTLDSLAASVHARMAAFEEQLKKEPSSKADTVKSLATEFQSFRAFVLTSFTSLQKQIDMLATEVDVMEMRNRRKMLLFHGVAEARNEDTAAVILAAAQKHLSLPNLKPEEIHRAHRIGHLFSVSGKPRPVLVKFSSTVTRNEAWMKKVGLKGTGITVSEFLTPRRHKLFKLARQTLGVSKCWTREGRIIYLAPDGKRHTISSAQDLTKIAGDSQVAEVEDAAKTPVDASKRVRTGKK
ncbi:hypothetical protein NE865_11737 [Phthorimaea operculella]|nr:hypothetical protein NE865_11737 [Phthorimaea operculella]